LENIFGKEIMQKELSSQNSDYVGDLWMLYVPVSGEALADGSHYLLTLYCSSSECWRSFPM
jgi:hypothetical protein